MGLLLCGCSSYQAGSFRDRTGPFAADRATVGCLDLALSRRPDYHGTPVIQFEVGNRCRHAATVDLANVPVVGRASDGSEHMLRPFDPRNELVVLKLDVHGTAREAISYVASTTIEQICLNVAAIAQRDPAHWMCFGGSRP